MATCSVDVHGSCVSRGIFYADDESIKVNQNFSRNNIVSCMMPPVDIKIEQSELEYTSDYANRCVQYSLNKQTLPKILESDSDYLVIDLFDFCQSVAMYKHTTFSTYDYTVLRAPSLKPYIHEITEINFLDLPNGLWYGYIDIYFEKIKEKFNDNIILVRLQCCNKFLTKTKTVLPTPERLLYFGNSKYNKALLELENYIIDKYNPYVIDVSKYFIADESFNADVTPVHFEEKYREVSWTIMKHIILTKPTQRYFDFISSNIVSELLCRPVSDENFKRIIQDSALPFTSCEFLDEICLSFDLNDIINNRTWLGKLYSCYKNEIGDNYENGINKINQFMNNYTKKKNDFINNEFIDLFEEKVQLKYELFNKSVEELLDCFFNAFNNDDINWITILSCLRILAPENKDVVFYSQQYYIAVNNLSKITQYNQTLKYVSSLPK